MSTTCQNLQCSNGNPVSRLECPTCNKLGIPGSFFCGQECFKSGLHKAIHGGLVSADGTYNPFPNFAYTGSMRPTYPLSSKRQIPAHIQLPDYVADGVPRSEIRASGGPTKILNAEEIEKMRTVCRLGREILDIAAAAIQPGVTTDALDEIVHNATIERDAYPSPLNYRNFPKSVCTSVNEVICHGIPDKTALKEGDIVNLDVSVYHQGFHADLNATYPVGKIDEESAKLLRVTRECLDKAIAMCNPGALFRDVGNVIEPHAKANGCSVVRTYGAHGINTMFHCAPDYIPHYAKNKTPGAMKAGMVFTIEPMINLGPSSADIHWPDNWTATTVDGKRSAQFEETLLITETGVEVLTAKPA